ncbi:DUF6777 domain-containing protein [Streptomyces echinatus]|uniref:DUF6777 domain-containing protein n=1 Tax=Streptomyces echinatus TaxID=67293 RepID=UPI0037A49E97
MPPPRREEGLVSVDPPSSGRPSGPPSGRPSGSAHRPCRGPSLRPPVGLRPAAVRAAAHGAAARRPGARGAGPAVVDIGAPHGGAHRRRGRRGDARTGLHPPGRWVLLRRRSVPAVRQQCGAGPVHGVDRAEGLRPADALRLRLRRGDGPGRAGPTNHGFRNGTATGYQSVLQAGTAVLVDGHGVPRVRCACGNPLGSPVAQRTTPKIVGKSWSAYRPGNVVVVRPAPAPVPVFVLYDPHRDEWVGRHRGDEQGRRDHDIKPPEHPEPWNRPTPSVSPSPSSGPPSASPKPTGTQPSRSPSASQKPGSSKPPSESSNPPSESPKPPASGLQPQSTPVAPTSATGGQPGQTSQQPQPTSQQQPTSQPQPEETSDQQQDNQQDDQRQDQQGGTES